MCRHSANLFSGIDGLDLLIKGKIQTPLRSILTWDSAGACNAITGAKEEKGYKYTFGLLVLALYQILLIYCKKKKKQSILRLFLWEDVAEG